MTGIKRDRYGRLIGKVIFDGVDINLEQIKNGLAWFYHQYQKELIESDRELYFNAEIEAKQTRLGLWVYPEQVAPWDFRKRKKETTN